MKHNRKRGISLVELVIVMVLMSLVVTICVSLISLTVKGVTSADQNLNTAMADADFAAKVSEAVRKSTTSFTIPHDSFNEIGTEGQPYLTWTREWSYLGLLDHVHIPAGASRTGKEISDAAALVYLEWIGDRLPDAGVYDLNVVNIIDRRDDGNGVFIQHIIAHDFTDLSGIEHHYRLIFEPTDASLKAPQSVRWTLNTTADYGQDMGVNTFETMIQALNAVQVVYQGSASNPAVALAFRSDFMPTSGTVTVRGTVVMLLDVSGSMTASRMETLKDNAIGFVEMLSEFADLNVLLVPFSGFAVTPGNYNAALVSDPGFEPCKEFVKASQVEELSNTVLSLQASGNTNLGDGFRYAFVKLREAEFQGQIGNDPIFIVVLTDGAVNCYTAPKSDVNAFYYPANLEDHVFAGDANYSRTIASKSVTAKGRQYMSYWAEAIIDEFTWTARGNEIDSRLWTVCASMYSGMSTADKNALRDAGFVVSDVDLTDPDVFREFFLSIINQIKNVMWAYEGPKT